MARKYYRKRYYKKKVNWSSRLTEINISQLVTANQTFFIYRTLATNPAQDDNTISQRFTVKNVQCQMEIQQTTGQAAAINFCQQYLLYIPQGFSLSENTPFEHPEWIMAHRWLGSPEDNETPYFPALKFSTRLARNLDTGDRIVYLFIGNNTSSESATINVNGIVKFNTKAN